MQPQTPAVSYILVSHVGGLHCRSKCTRLRFAGNAVQMYILCGRLLPDYQQQIKFLRNLQELRSTGTGHRKGKGHEKAAGVFGLNTDNYVDVFDRILLQANAFILFLAKNFLKDWTVTLS